MKDLNGYKELHQFRKVDTYFHFPTSLNYNPQSSALRGLHLRYHAVADQYPA